MQAIQQDVFDIQAQDSVPDLIKAVTDGLDGASKNDAKTADHAINVLRAWDFRYDVESTGAAIMVAWEH
jgi:acyl-homoserine lactone acylase PvdQ